MRVIEDGIVLKRSPSGRRMFEAKTGSRRMAALIVVSHRGRYRVKRTMMSWYPATAPQLMMELRWSEVVLHLVTANATWIRIIVRPEWTRNDLTLAGTRDQKTRRRMIASVREDSTAVVRRTRIGRG